MNIHYGRKKREKILLQSERFLRFKSIAQNAFQEFAVEDTTHEPMPPHLDVVRCHIPEDKIPMFLTGTGFNPPLKRCDMEFIFAGNETPKGRKKAYMYIYFHHHDAPNKRTQKPSGAFINKQGMLVDSEEKDLQPYITETVSKILGTHTEVAPEHHHLMPHAQTLKSSTGHTLFVRRRHQWLRDFLIDCQVARDFLRLEILARMDDSQKFERDNRYWDALGHLSGSVCTQHQCKDFAKDIRTLFESERMLSWQAIASLHSEIFKKWNILS